MLFLFTLAVGSTFSDILLMLSLLLVDYQYACMLCSLNELFRENGVVEPRDKTRTTVMIIKPFQTFERSDCV